MNCDKVRRLITSRFVGGITASEEIALEKHLESCPDCRDYLDQEQQMTESLRSLDYGIYREASIQSFGRLAVAVRSYRTPKASWIDTLNYKPARLAYVATMLLVIMVGLSNLNFSYSYTSGASLNISFDPPLQKSESIEIDEFYTRINESLNKILDSTNSSRDVSWTIQMDGESLKEINIDVATDESVDVIDVYDSLLEYYPSLASGELSISPLRESIKDKPIRILVNRKSDSLSVDDIKGMVTLGVPQVIAKVERDNLVMEQDTEKLRNVIEEQLPEIMLLIDETIDKTNLTIQGMDLITIRDIDEIKQPDEIDRHLSPQKEIETNIYKLLEEKGVTLEDMGNLLHIEVDGGTSRIIIGDDSCKLFDPKACGGKKISIIRGSGDEINLNGASDLVKSSEIDDLIEGRIKADELQKIIESRIGGKNDNSTVIIDIFKGEKKAEIKIDNNKAVVNLTSPIIPNLKIKMPSGFDPDDKNDFQDLKAWKEKLEAEREIVLQQYVNPGEAFKNPNVILQLNPVLSLEVVEESEIDSLLSGALKKDELEKRIENRLVDKNIDSDRSISFIRDSKMVAITITNGKVTIDISNIEDSNLGNGSIIVKHKADGNAKAKASAWTGLEIDIFKDGYISDSEIDELISGDMLPSVMETLIESRLTDKHGEAWKNGFQTAVVKARNYKSVSIEIENGEVEVSISSKQSGLMKIVAQITMA